MDGKQNIDRQTSRIANAEEFNLKKEDDNSQSPEIGLQLSGSKYPSAEKVLKVFFAGFLFLLVLGSGFVARITLHILVWHINPPTDNTSTSTLKTFGGILIHNCTSCNSRNKSACSSHRVENQIDETWIWAVFLVVVAPYVLTFLSTLFRICFKSNKPLQWKVLGIEIIVETIHSVGISIMAFLVLPSFDPASASVVYMAVTVFPPVFDIIDKIVSQRDDNKKYHFFRVSLKISLIFPILGAIMQIAGIILIGVYMKIDWLIGLFVMAAVFVSIKYWENFITMGHKGSKYLRRLKLELQEGRTKVTCLVNLWKIIVSFLALIIIFTSRTESSMSGFKSLFNSGVATLHGVFGKNQIGDDLTCRNHVPFVVAFINIICDYLCYKSAKTICVIYCQRFGFCIPMLILPCLTTFTLIGLMYNSDLLKLDSCDLTFSEWCLIDRSKLLDHDFELVIAAFAVLYVSLIFITRHIWKASGYKHGETARIFVSPFYCGLFLDLSLSLNRRRDDTEYDVITGKKSQEISNRGDNKPMLYACCATMWHETANEMKQLLKSIFRLDMRQYMNNLIDEQMKQKSDDDEDKIDDYDVETFDLEAHVFFDDAFDPIKDDEKYPDANEYVKTFIRVIEEAGSIVHGKQIQLPDGEMYRTPYGARIEWELPGKNRLFVHLKDKNKIRHKKRWSQVMYMYYILQWKLLKTHGKSGIQAAAENTYLLALDGDVDFEPEAVLSLMRRMKKSNVVGAACGRIHPIGSGPMVWYQKFEYAVSHWLQKATEHVIGCVLCSPGCFSLFRGSAILHPDVLETYTTVPKEAQHFVQYDQGEDRWLCTLLLKQGWKVEYCAESDAYTFAPEGFYEFYNQRRRWTPSTMANILDLIVDWRKVTKNNENISFLYIVYQVFLFVSTLLTPGTIFMIILGAIIIGFQAIPPWLALILNLIPVAIFLLMCLYASSQRQLQYAAILSSVYVIVMVIVLIGVIKDAVDEGLCSMTTIFILFVAGVFVISAIVHPKEFLCLIPGLLYFVAIPSMSMLMFLYSIGNLHVVSWGTRETKQQTTEPKTAKRKHEPEKEERGYFCSLGHFFSCMFCPTNTYTKEDFLYQNMMNKVKHMVDKDDKIDNQIQENGDVKENLNKDVESTPRKTTQKDIRKAAKKEQEEEFHLYADNTVPKIAKDERKFWEKIINQYLKPLDKDQEKEKAILEELIDLRNRVCLFVFLLNAILVTVMFGLTQVNSFKDSLSIDFICKGNDVTIVPISILFAVVFGLLLLLQFLCMLYHRFSTLVHITASTDIFDSKQTKISKMNMKMAEYLTSPIIAPAPKSTFIHDKQREILEMNRSIMKGTGKQFGHLEDVVQEKMRKFEDSVKKIQGSLYLKHQKSLADKVISRWAHLGENPRWKNAVAKVKENNRKTKLRPNRKEDDMYEDYQRPTTPGLNKNKVAPTEEKHHRRQSISSTSSREDSKTRSTLESDSASETPKNHLGNDSNV